MGAGLTEGLREVSFLVLGVGLGRASWLMRLGNWNPELLEDWRPAGWHHVWLCACCALPVRLCLRAQGTQLSWGEGREKLCSWCRVSEVDPTYSLRLAWAKHIGTFPRGLAWVTVLTAEGDKAGAGSSAQRGGLAGVSVISLA